MVPTVAFQPAASDVALVVLIVVSGDTPSCAGLSRNIGQSANPLLARGRLAPAGRAVCLGAPAAAAVASVPSSATAATVVTTAGLDLISLNT